MSVTIEVRGYADAVGAEASNLNLSLRRADAVRDFLVSCGLDGDMLKPLGLGAPPPPEAGEKPQPEESDRRVALRVIPQPSVSRP
jgi:OOP family OmpA-OmpF porin